MPSSISSFDRAITSAPTHVVSAPDYLTWSIRTVASLLLFLIFIEGLTRIGFSHISHIEVRISTDHKAVLGIRKKNRPTVLIVGNSLMLLGIDYSQLRDSVGEQAHVVGFPIEQTQYLDWYYGLRRIFAEGSQPDMVVLCMDVGDLTSSKIRGDYSAYYLFRLTDIPLIHRDTNYDLTKTSSLVLSRFSLFYAGRSPIRNFVLLFTDPSYARWLHRISTSQALVVPDPEIERIAVARLAALSALSSLHHAGFSFLLAPGFGSGEAPLKRAGERSRTDVMIPVNLNELGRDKFMEDGYHLNAYGARIFTGKIAELLKTRLPAMRRTY